MRRGIDSRKRIIAKMRRRRSIDRPTATTKARRPSDLRQVNFVFFDSNAESVFVAGTFNGWDSQASPLRKVGGGEWCLQLLLASGRYEYRFLVDGQWRRDPAAVLNVTDFCGGVNSILDVR